MAHRPPAGRAVVSVTPAGTALRTAAGQETTAGGKRIRRSAGDELLCRLMVQMHDDGLGENAASVDAQH